MNDETRAERFLGMTKFQFMGVMMVFICILFAGTVYNLSFSVRENRERLLEIDANQARLDALAVKAAEDHEGLCAFVADLDQRADANRKILREQPGAVIRIGGLEFERKLLEQSVANQESTLLALRPVRCTAP